MRLRPEWYPDWSGECAAVIGSGPSLKQSDVDKLRSRIHVVVINENYRLAPWADALYGADANWWRYNAGVKSFPGMKISQDEVACSTYSDVHRLVCRTKPNRPSDYVHELVLDELGVVGSGGNSSFQAVNWLVQVGIRGILLLGLDMRDHDGKIHWHGRHADTYRNGYILNNPAESNFKLWRNSFEIASIKLKSMDVDVVNCSPISALGCFPKMSVEQALERWGL
jgi:hypothetical protein